MNVEVKSIEQLLHPNFDDKALERATAVSKMGLPASPGAASGEIVFLLKLQNSKLNRDIK